MEIEMKYNIHATRLSTSAIQVAEKRMRAHLDDDIFRLDLLSEHRKKNEYFSSSFIYLFIYLFVGCFVVSSLWLWFYWWVAYTTRISFRINPHQLSRYTHSFASLCLSHRIMTQTQQTPSTQTKHTYQRVRMFIVSIMPSKKSSKTSNFDK